jgi:hypothetical protein
MCGCGRKVPAGIRFAYKIAELRARIAFLEKHLSGRTNRGDPCTPIEDLTPPNANELLLICCLESRASYLECLADSQESQAACDECEQIYRADVKQCIAAGS